MNPNTDPAPSCQSCGTHWTEHPGIVATCAENIRLRVIEGEHQRILATLKDPAAVHANMLHGTIAWTPELLKHIIGDPCPKKPAKPLADRGDL